MSTSRVPFRVDQSHFACVVRRPVAILMATLAVGVFGWVSYQRLALTLMPDMSYPTLTVRTAYPGTAPEEIENVVSRPLEQQLGIIPKLVSISSVSKAGLSDVILEFQWKTDMDLVAQAVREKIDRIRFPDGAQRPLLLHYDPSLDPILRVGLAGPQSLYELRYIAENDVKRRLEAIPGVAAIQVKGGLQEEFLVAIDESKLATLRLDITQIGQRLEAGNVNMPGGNLREGQTEYLIRTMNEFRTLEEIGALIIARQNNVDIRLSDIATVTRFHKDREVITRVNGRESVEIEIYKEADANVLVVAAAVRDGLFGREEQQAYVASLKSPPVKKEAPKAAAPAPDPKMSAAAKKKAAQAAALAEGERVRNAAQELITRRQMTDFLGYQLPPGAGLQVLSDQSIFIRNSIDEVKENAVFGGLIAIAVLYLFLRNVTQTLIVSLCIPISILATFAPMYMADVSLNIISLGGLALGVGNLVDNAIVVLESIFRCREEGDDPVTAVVRGTGEVAMPVIASTLTTVAVFFPIVFVEGVAGQVFGDMALAVVFSQIASLIAAIYLIPMLASRAAGGVGSGAVAQAAAAWRGSDILRFPAHAGGSRLVHAGRILARVGAGILWGGIVMVAALLKGVVALAAVVIWPVIGLPLAASSAIRGRKSGTGVPPVKSAIDGNFVGGTPMPRGYPAWGRLSGWAAADSFIGLRSERIWPGLLGFAAPAALAERLRKLWTWLIMPPRWRLAVRAVPAVVAAAFLIVRFAAEAALRLLGVGLQVLLLVVAQALIGVVSAVALLVAPVSGTGLNWFEHGNHWLQDNYPRLLKATLSHRGSVLGGAFVTLVICCVFVVPRLGSNLIPQVHQGEFNLEITLPIGTPLERTGEVAAQIDAAVIRQPEVERTALTVGAEAGASTAIEAGEHTARLTVKMRPGQQADDETALIDRIRAEFGRMPETKLEVSYPALFSFKSPIEIEVRGHDLTTLKRVSREAEQVLAETVPGLVDIRSSLQSGHPEIQVVYQRDRLAEYNLSLRNVADLVRHKVQGRIATEFRQEDQLIDIVVRLREEDRFGLEELRRLVVNPNGAVPIPLSAVAELTVNEGPSEIRRVDQQRTALITANILGTDLATVSRDIVTALETLEYPPGFSYGLAGQNQEMRTSLNSLLLAFALAVFLVYIVMASQFESLVQPFLIMMTVPLAMIGVVLVLWIARIPVTIMVFLGLIILVGIVVNNAIVLIDYINTLRGRGLEKMAAIIEAGRARLRPIIMTALTTVVGLIPMALGMGEGAEIRAPLAITVIVGLSTATVLTLVVIPTLYYQFTGKDAAPAKSDAETAPSTPVSVPVGK